MLSNTKKKKKIKVHSSQIKTKTISYLYTIPKKLTNGKNALKNGAKIRIQHGGMESWKQ
jgi:hypothetical protein